MTLIDRKNIKSNMQQLRKLFIMPDTPDKFVEFGNELLGLIHNFFQDKGGIHSSISLRTLKKLFSDINMPRDPQLISEVLDEIKNKIIAHSVKVGNPYYIGHMTSAVPYFMILLEMIIVALNQNQVKIESAKASSYVEREVLAWFHRLIYDRNDEFYKKNIQNHTVALGNVTVDGTMANLTALLVARNSCFPKNKKFAGVDKAGLSAAYRYYGYERAVIMVSRRSHYSIDKAARILGIGDDNVIKVPVDSRNRMDIRKLEEICDSIARDNKSGKQKTRIIAIIGIAGTTETGNIDNLKEIGRIARQQDAFFHVDAAWGGAVMLLDELRYLFSGIERADSVAVDAHKLFYCPVSMGMILFKDERSLNSIKHYSNYIIRQDSVDQGRFTIEGSRSFAALKPWAAVKIIGIKGFHLLFKHAFDLTSVLRGLVERHYNFEPMNEPELFIFNYRFVPASVMDTIESIRLKIGERDFEKIKHDNSKLGLIKKLKKINVILNELNKELHKAIRQEDESFVSRTTIDSAKYYYQDIVILRSITINPLTDHEVLGEIIEAQNRLGLEIYKSEFKKRFEIF